MFQSATLVILASLVLGEAQEAEALKTTIPADVLTEFKFMVGSWEAVYAEGDLTGKGDISTSWSIDRQAIVSNQSWDIAKYGKIKSVELNGWDTSTKEMIETTFFSGGGGAVRKYQLKGPGIWEGSARNFHADGAVETSTVR